MGRLLTGVFNDKVMLGYSNDAGVLLKHSRFCGLINQKAARSCFTSLKEKLSRLPLTPPWRAPTQVCSGGHCPPANTTLFTVFFFFFLVQVNSGEGKNVCLKTAEFIRLNREFSFPLSLSGEQLLYCNIHQASH